MVLFAVTDRSILRYASEAQWSVTPGSGVTREARIVSHSMSTKKSTVKSNEIRDDRMVSDIIETEMMSDGNVSFEFSAGAVDDYFQAFMQGAWTRPMTFDEWSGSGVSWGSSSTVTIVGQGDLTHYLTVGRYMKTEGFVAPNNNGYFTISSLSYSAPTFTITFSQSTGTTEAGNVGSRVSDANDVIVLKSTAIRSGTSGASAFDSNSGNAFSSAITAGQLNAGQKIYVEGLGYETGSFAFAAVCVALSTLTVNDGTNSYTFVAGTDFAVGSANTDSATNLAAAINQSRALGIGAAPGIPAVNLQVNASVSSGTVTITNLKGIGGTLSKTEPASGTNITATNFSGGHANEHGVYTIVSAANDVLTVTPAPATNANAGSLPVTIKGSMLRNPGVAANIVAQSFSFESFYEDIGKGFLQNGMMPNSFTLDLNAASIMTGSFDFMGKATTTLTTPTLGNTGTYNVLGTVNNEVLNATTDVGSLLMNNAVLSTAIKQIKVDGKGGLRNQMAVSNKFPVGIGTGRMEISGTAQVYFADLATYNIFLNHTTVSLGWNVFDSNLNTYYFTIPSLVFTSDPINVKGIDQDVMEDIAWEAYRDPVTNCQMQIDRFSSLNVVLG